jgi:hypothetical protein
MKEKKYFLFLYTTFSSQLSFAAVHNPPYTCPYFNLIRSINSYLTFFKPVETYASIPKSTTKTISITRLKKQEISLIDGTEVIYPK